MIEIKNLIKMIDQTTVLSIEELKIEPGEIAVIAGPVDSGRQILFRLLIGHMQPSGGKILINGANPYRQTRDKSYQIGVLFAEGNIYLRQSVFANLQFYNRLYGLPRERTREILHAIGLSDHAEVRAGKLSFSLKRRLAFGCAIIHTPKALILEEPFRDCDQQTISLMQRLIKALAGQGVCVLILAEETASLLSLADVIYTLDRGRIAETVHPAEEKPVSGTFKIAARQAEKVILINPGEVLFASAQGDRAHLHTLEDELPTQYNLTELENRLKLHGFFRAHRSYLVNLQHVSEVIPYTRDSFTIRLDDPEQTEIPLSKSAARALKELLDF